ncbi:hypothetical protein VIGAN_02025600 [Vigna angularis var. angularis]|uniref:Uncharacterized protein n=1 Tax=Vigna angularis var. angularis TaxID=157739 RepID=A0A0S3RAN8_PHAAN|nr:hypothetical protein VIGAN_02025600 [Vigna angularis var. angularis]
MHRCNMLAKWSKHVPTNLIGPFLRTPPDKENISEPSPHFLLFTSLPHFSVIFGYNYVSENPILTSYYLPFIVQKGWPMKLAHRCYLMFPTFFFFFCKRTIKSSTFVFFCNLSCYCSWRNYTYLGDSTGKERICDKSK